MVASDRTAELEAWAAELVGEPIESIRRRPGGGRHEAWDVIGARGGTWFLRADSHRPEDHEHYTLRREAEIYRAVREVGLPAPAILGVHPVHEAVLMDHVPGEAAFAPLGVDAQSAIVADFAPLLARLHLADVHAMNLPGLGPVRTIEAHVEHELDIWEARLDSMTVPDPFLRSCFLWLRDNLPAVERPPSLVQGDTGPGNFLHDGAAVTALLDFELAHLGDPMEDLAWVGTRNAQDPVPDFDEFLRLYADAGGAPFDSTRFRYHALFAELRIAVLGAERRGGGGPAPLSDLGNGLIYGALHRRLTVEAFAAAAGAALPEIEAPPATDTDRTPYFDGALVQMREILGPAISDPFATQRLKGMARVLKYLREIDRVGAQQHTEAELTDLTELLGERPETAIAGRIALDQRVRAGDLGAVDLLPFAAREVARMQQVTAPAMGVLATRQLPSI